MKRTCAVLFVDIILLFNVAGVDRVALVIGNAAYRTGAALANPAADAEDIAASLRALGFSVTLLTDASLSRMEQALLAFRAELIAKPGAVALFFFAGHGIQSQGVNYLLPIDQELRTEQMLKRMAISAQDVLDYMDEGKTRVNIFFLDACRNNPFAAQFRSLSRGLAVTGVAPPETLVVYSTAAGDIAEDGKGRNSPFVQALLGRIRTPAVDIETMLREVTKDVQGLTGTRQTPYRYSSLTSGFSFYPSAAKEKPVTSVGNTTPPPSKSELPQSTKTGALLIAEPMRIERGTVVWGNERYESNLLFGYESFMTAVEKRMPTAGELGLRIRAYRQGFLLSNSLKVFGIGMIITTGILASNQSDATGPDAETALYASIVAGVVLFSGGFILDPGVPVKVVEAYNVQISR